MLKISVILFLVICCTLIAEAQTTAQQIETINHSKPDTNKINLLIDLGGLYESNAPGAGLIADSGLRCYNIALDLSIKLHEVAFQKKILTILAQFYSLIGDKANAIGAEKKLMAVYRQNNDVVGVATCWEFMGDYCDDLNLAHLYYQNAKEILKNAGKKIEEIDATKRWGDVLLRAGKIDSAKSVLVTALQQYKAVGYKKLFKTYDLLASISFMQRNTNEELFYRLEVVKSVDASGGDIYLQQYYYTLSGCYWRLHKYEECAYYAKKATTMKGDVFFMSVCRAVNSFISLNKPSEALIFLQGAVKKRSPVIDADKHMINGAFAEIYTAQRQYDKAEKYYIESLKLLAVIQPNSVGVATFAAVQTNTRLYEEIINFYVLTNQFNKAANYLKMIPADYDSKINAEYLILLNKLRFKVDSASGNYVSAIRDLQRYMKSNDSVFSAKNTTAIEEIDAKYQTERKEQSIKTLQSERILQNMQIQRAVLQRNITLTAVIIALTLIGFGYNVYRRKQLSAQLIAQKNNQLEILLADNEQSSALISKKNDQLQMLLAEKDWLLKEVHHRVKNNLHTVFCLLESQSKYLADDALKAIEVSQHRIYAMSLIHQKLYQSDDIKTVDMKVYLLEFIGYLSDSFDTGKYIRFETDIEAITLDIVQAIPVALIINEAVTNAIKYAFPGGKNGVIKISFKQDENDIWLNVDDNGVGIDSLIDVEQLNSLGLVLMRGLTEDLHGIFTIQNNRGIQVEVVFPMADALVV